MQTNLCVHVFVFAFHQLYFPYARSRSRDMSFKVTNKFIVLYINCGICDCSKYPTKMVSRDIRRVIEISDKRNGGPLKTLKK